MKLDHDELLLARRAVSVALATHGMGDDTEAMRALSNRLESLLDPEQAQARLFAGQHIRMTIGPGPEDPVLDVYIDEGMVMHRVLAGWSAGVVEPICAAPEGYQIRATSSSFLLAYLRGGDLEAVA